MKYLITILLFVMLFFTACAESVEYPTSAPDREPAIESRGPLPGNPGTLMGEQDLLIYFTSHFIDGHTGYDSTTACDQWTLVYDALVHYQLEHEYFVFDLVILQELGGDDVPDELDIEPPC